MLTQQRNKTAKAEVERYQYFGFGYSFRLLPQPTLDCLNLLLDYFQRGINRRQIQNAARRVH